MKNSSLLAGALAAGLILPGIVMGPPLPANAQQNVSSGQTGGSVAFVRDATNVGMFEVQSGNLALQRAQNVGVRAFATRSIKDASEMLNRVKFINEANVSAPIPTAIDNEMQARLSNLTGLSGPDFDREYMRLQIEVSDFLAKTCRGYGANGESPTLRLYAARAATDYDAQAVLARTVAGSL
jgi:putative membrane protein